MMCSAAAPVEAESLGQVLVEDRFVSGRVGDYHYEQCLDVRLTREMLVIRPGAWAAHHPSLWIPLEAVVCVYAHVSRYAPRIEFSYQQRGGPRLCSFSPGNPRLWLQHIQELGLLVRPHGLDLRAVPERNRSHLVRNALAGLLASGFISAALLTAGQVLK